METLLSITRAQQALHIGETGEAAAARRQAVLLAQRLGLDETRAGRVALVATEAATNIEKHAGEGEILLQTVSDGDLVGVEILALDRGPGMASLENALVDGRSSVGTYGVGLGAMRRQADEFDAWSHSGMGTALRMVVWSAAPAQPRRAGIKLGTVCLPYPGETVCGDAWLANVDEDMVTLMVCDGLGHGAAASQAAAEACRAASGNMHPPAMLIHQIDAAMRGTRGAALALARVDRVAGMVDFAGVGNIAASVCGAQRRHQLVSHNGIVGATMNRVQAFTTPWEAGSLFIAHSDGMSSRWQLADYPGLLAAHPALVAGVLYRDYRRGRDDTTVLVMREEAS